MFPTLVFAEDSYNKIAVVSKAFLNALKWAGYAIALGILIFFGIKYLLSAANARADIKKKIFPFIAGVILISLCVTIAQNISEIGTRGEEGDASTSFIDKAIALSGITISDKAAMQQTTNVKVNEENGIIKSTEYTYLDGSYMVETYHDANGKLIATQTYYDGEGTAAENRTQTISYDNDGKKASEKKYLEDGTYEETKYVDALSKKENYIFENIVNSRVEMLDKNNEKTNDFEFDFQHTGTDGEYKLIYYDSNNNIVGEGEMSYIPMNQGNRPTWVMTKNTMNEDRNL